MEEGRIRNSVEGKSRHTDVLSFLVLRVFVLHAFLYPYVRILAYDYLLYFPFAVFLHVYIHFFVLPAEHQVANELTRMEMFIYVKLLLRTS